MNHRKRNVNIEFIINFYASCTPKLKLKKAICKLTFYQFHFS
jgi:hypothetical protein